MRPDGAEWVLWRRLQRHGSLRGEDDRSGTKSTLTAIGELLKIVIPAQAGIYKPLKILDPRLGGDDKK